MAELTIAMTYGNALYEAAKETGKKQIIMDEAEQIMDIFSENTELYDFLNCPAIAAEDKKTAVKNIFEGQLSREFLNFFYVLIDKRRTVHLKNILKEYRNLMNKEEGLSFGTVYSVTALKEDQILKLENGLSGLLKTKVRLTNEIDMTLIGGMKILVEGRIIDTSLKKKFEDLERQIILNRKEKK